MEKFWKWHQKHYRLNVGVAAGLFILQLVHLFWLTTDVVAFRLFEVSYFDPAEFWKLVIGAVDYTEIPAIIAASLIYVQELRRGFSWRAVWFLLFINSQWLHLFWITDEVVVDILIAKSRQTLLPIWLAWLAIFLDYLELPVIADTARRAIKSTLRRV